MKVGILKEIKVLEKRACMVSSDVATMIANDHEVMDEKASGNGAGFPDAEYVAAGAIIVKHSSGGFCRIRYGYAR